MPLPSKDLYRFDEFRLEPAKRSFLRNGSPVLVSPKAFEVLTYLVSNPGRVVTKEELLTAVWPDSFVEESNLSQHISLLRKAFADRSSYIATVPSRGYQFTATVHTEPSNSALESPIAERSGNGHAQPGVEKWEAADIGPAAGDSSNTASLDGGSAAHLAVGSPDRLKILVVVGVLAAVAILAAFFGYKRFETARSRHAVSIAVLPFTNLTGDPSKEYLPNGITEEVINSLARSKDGRLRVIAHASSLSYKGSSKPVREIARELGVEYVLTGSVQSEGNHLHVIAQLIRGDDQSYLWADTFEGDATQILEFEDRLTTSVAHSLALTLLVGGTPEHIPINAAAHDAYLQGLYHLSQRSKPELESALQSFGSAVAQDPRYARAYAELAVTYNLIGQFNWMDTHQAHSQAKAAALQAIAADPGLAEGHAALGFTKWFYEWNSAAAEQELLQAVELEPTNVDARHWYALVLMTGGRLPEADKQMRAALALDPKALILRTNLGWLHYMGRQYPLALQEIQSVVKDNPDFITAHYKLWWVYSVTGDIPHAWQELETVAHLIFTSDNEKAIVSAYEKGGYAAALKTRVSSNDGHSSEGLVDDARCMSFAGDNAAALQLLERALKNNEGWMIFVESDPAFDSLRSDPEYSRLVREIHATSDATH